METKRQNPAPSTGIKVLQLVRIPRTPDWTRDTLEVKPPETMELRGSGSR